MVKGYFVQKKNILTIVASRILKSRGAAIFGLYVTAFCYGKMHNIHAASRADNAKLGIPRRNESTCFFGF